MEIALKVDVDTHRGLGEGVPRLMTMLGRKGVTASFFIAMGPDNSGRAVMRALKNPGFLTKMRRTRAVSMYGLRTVLSGTLLPARPIALAFPQVMRDLAQAGFETGVHGYDHVRWQDHLDELGCAGTSAEIDDGFEVYRAVFGSDSNSFAAPGWRTSRDALAALRRKAISYHSDTRGRTPYRCMIGGTVMNVPEIPTTLPTLDEVLGTREVPDGAAAIRYYSQHLDEAALNVHTIHAETEGMGELPTFAAIIDAWRDRGATFVQLGHVAQRLDAEALPVCEVIRMTLPGRAGWISAQGRATS
ncbi:MAG TPA: polysaccharide deacetylase family protein [Candidatus Binataceae bacterium]|jgi:peptidoglycan/xylan/chitin deacetylase (PgdA/CDA1 family)|nr:polysaccharide deacetylase family protein [Candidatus Binataceae bacterium]